MQNIVENAKKIWKKTITFKILWIVASTIFFLDHFIKRYLQDVYFSHSIPVINKIFYITVVFNRGAAFGIFQKYTFLLICVSAVFILFLLLVFIKRIPQNKISFFSSGLILGGALSNLYDRIFLGYVVDYLDFCIWPVFNLSDTCISVGVTILFWQIFSSRKREK